MSTITVTNIKATGETASRAVSGVAAADIRFACNTATIDASNNISTITDNGVGDFSVNFSNGFADTTYGHLNGVTRGASTTVIITFEGRANAAIASVHAVGSFRGEVVYVNSTANRTNIDAQRVSSTFHGDLA